MNIDLKTAAAYIRVSTDNQTELSPDSQIKVVQQYAKQHGFFIPREFIFRDDGISGRHADKRPAFNDMIATAKTKPSPFSAVLLWKFSRFARNQEESIFYKSMLRKNGIEVISVSEPMIDGPFGTLIERIIEWSDEYYSIRLSGEVKRGMTERVERGGAVSVPAFGYSIQNKQYIINPGTAPLVKKIFADFLSGVPILSIAKRLNSLGVKTTRGNAWENRTIEYILRNPVYIGKIRWNPKRKTNRNYNDPDIMIADGTHDPIIDVETFDQVQQKLDENKRRHKPYVRANTQKYEYMLHGLVKCSNCGASLTAVNKTSMQCVKYAHGKCSVSHSVSISRINTSVIDAIEQSFETGNFNLTIKRAAMPEPEIDAESLIKKEQLKLRRIREAYEDGVYTLEEYKESKQLITNAIKQLENCLVQQPIDIDAIKRKFIDKHKSIIPQLKSNISESDKNEILKEIIEKITFSRSTASVELFFYI